MTKQDTPFRRLIQNWYAAYFEFLPRHWRHSRHSSVASTRQLSANLPLRQLWITCWLVSAEPAPCLLAQICVTANSAADGWRHSLFCFRPSCLHTLKWTVLEVRNTFSEQYSFHYMPLPYVRWTRWTREPCSLLQACSQHRNLITPLLHGAQSFLRS
jgi:hypothetical protein